MSSIERTAYPRFASGRTLKEHELEKFYSITPDELSYINGNIRGATLRLNFAVQLKTFQRLGYFPAIKNIPDIIIAHIKKCLCLFDDNVMPYYDHDKTRYRHQDRICAYLKINRWRKNKNRLIDKPHHPGRHLATQIAYKAARTMNNPADIINVVIEELIHNNYELPAFEQLNRLVKHTRSLANRQIYARIYQQLDDSLLKSLDNLFLRKSGYSKTGYNSLKHLPKNATITHFKELLEHHDWLLSFGNTEKYLVDISKIKLQQFCVEAKSLDASDFKEMNVYRRYALIICLISHAQRKAKESLVIMYCRTMAKIHKKADAKYISLCEQQEEKTKHLLVAFHDVLVACKEEKSLEIIGENVLSVISNHGGVYTLHSQCEQVVAYHSNSYLPLLWEYFSPKRSTLLKLARILNIQTASQDKSLINALYTLLNNSHSKAEYLKNENVDVSFAPEKWQKLICKHDKQGKLIARRYLEMAVFSCLSNELRSGDIFIEGAETYADYRKELLEWDACEPLINEYCDEVNMPNNAQDFVKKLRHNFSEIANKVDAQFPYLTEFIIDANGNPILKKRTPKQRSSQAIWLAQEIKS